MEVSWNEVTPQIIYLILLYSDILLSLNGLVEGKTYKKEP